MINFQEIFQDRKVPSKIQSIIEDFAKQYVDALEENGYGLNSAIPLLNTYIHLILDQIENPYKFDIFHTHITEPFNFYQFGLDFIRPWLKIKQSKIFHPQNLEKIVDQLSRRENVILLSNHQTEADPQIISLLLEKKHPKLAEDMIFVAGHRVVTDPVAAAMSKGCNLLCIYSKKYIDSIPELKEERLLHNQKSMKRLMQLLSTGGRCVYVAPSGGRDRLGDDGLVSLAKFDAKSIEMFRLTGKGSSCLTHFYPFAMDTYKLLPPPDKIHIELGEKRIIKAAPAAISFGNELDMDCFKEADKQSQRDLRADYIWKEVNTLYQEIVT